MLESNIYKGAESAYKIPGVSLTDPCLSFEETKHLLMFAKEKIAKASHMEELYPPTSYECSH